MKIGLQDLISVDGKKSAWTVPFERDVISSKAGTYPVLSKTPVALTAENVGDKVLEVDGKCTLTVGIPCDRCLEETAVEIPIAFSHRFDMKLSDEERVRELDESICLTGTELDVDTLVGLEALLGWPFKVLCRPDCKGLCSRCGKNLNEGPCSCDDEPKDPRMAAIWDVFNQSAKKR